MDFTDLRAAAEAAVRAGVTEDQVEGVILARSLRDYMKAAWRYVDPDPLLWGWHNDAMCEHLEAVSAGEIESLLINVSPGCTKSLTCSVFWPTWEWAKRPEGRWFCASYDQELSTRDSLKCRNLIQSPWYQARWGHVYQLAGDQNRKTLFENTRKGWRLATSVAGHGLGEHPDRVVYDDLLDSRRASSALERAAVVDWIKTTMSTRGAARGVRRVAIMQRLHEEDPAAHFLAEGGWTHLMLPMRYEPRRKCVTLWHGKDGTAKGFSDPRTEAGELMAPQQYPEPVVARLEKALGPYAAAAQLQQLPSPAEGGIIKREWLRFWRPRGVELGPVRDIRGHEYPVVERPLTFEQEVQSWDCSKLHDAEQIRKLKESDPVSGGVWGRFGADCYLLDRVNRQMDLVETCAAIADMSEAWPRATGKLIEYAANGVQVIAILKREVGGLIPVTPVGSKVQRVTGARTDKAKDARSSSMVVLFNSGNVYLPHPVQAPWVWEYIEELCGFPNAPHDDDVDMTSQALAFLQPGVWRAENEAEDAAANPPPRDLVEQQTRSLHASVKKAIQRAMDKRNSRIPGL